MLVDILTNRYDRQYGIDWPREMPGHQRELLLWQKHKEAPYKFAELRNPISEHFLAACRSLFTPEQLVFNEWFERMADGYTTHDGLVLWGPASAGKSHFVGIAFLMEYLADLQNTYCCMVSTTKDMLLLRSFASTIEYLGYLKSNPNFVSPIKYVAQKFAVVPDYMSDTQVASLKAQVKGVAIREGATEDAKSSIMGVHLPYTRACADEFENMGDRAKAFLDAQSNLAACKDFKVIYCFNPQSLYNPGCSVSVPKGGWNSVSVDSESWETESGNLVLHFDAMKSPGRTDPVKYYFLPTDKTIARILKENNGNEDAPNYWTFVRGFPPPMASERTVLTESMVQTYNMLERPRWRDMYDRVRVAALDPSFTSDGDDCVLQTATVGMTENGVLAICFDTTYVLNILGSSGVPVTEQIAQQTVDILKAENITIDHFGCDDSGTQSVADVIAMKLGIGLYRCNFAAKPPDLAVSVANTALASKHYRNVVTWLYYTVKEYGEFGQIKGLPVKAAEEFCRRRLGTKLPRQLESKADMKKRIRRSPDTGDACAILVGLVRERLGVAPGASQFTPGGGRPPGTDVFNSFSDRYNNLDLDQSNRYVSDLGVVSERLVL